MWQITLELTINADYCLIKYVYSYILKKLDVACLFKLKRATLPAVSGESITIPVWGTWLAARFPIRNGWFLKFRKW